MLQKWILSLAGCLLFFSVYSQKDVSWDIKKGNEVAGQIEKTIGLVHHPNAEKTIKDIGDRLVSQLTDNPFIFSFHIIDQSEPNAFALPGGHVYISRGLVALINNEDELAGVLGHEVSHVIKRHSAKQQRKAILPTIIAVPGILLGSTIGGSVGDKIAAPLLGAGKLFLASYSRKQETEADELGISLASKAGYQPSALGDILHRLELSLQLQSGQEAHFSFFNDHPMTPDRMKSIYSQSKNMTVSTLKPSFEPDDFLGSFNHLLFGANPSHGIFNKNVFLHPTMKIFWELPVDWKYSNEATAAGAFQKENQILVTVAGKERQLDTLIDNFVNGYYAKTRKQPISDTKVKMPGRTGSELIVPASQNNKIIYTLWFKKDKMTYVILATGDKSMSDTFRHCGQTFRDLEPSDFPLISFQELMTVNTLPGETLTQVGKRTGDSSSTKFSAIMNGVEEEDKLKTGQLIKIILSKPYPVKGQ